MVRQGYYLSLPLIASIMVAWMCQVTSARPDVHVAKDQNEVPSICSQYDNSIQHFVLYADEQGNDTLENCWDHEVTSLETNRVQKCDTQTFGIKETVFPFLFYTCNSDGTVMLNECPLNAEPECKPVSGYTA